MQAVMIKSSDSRYCRYLKQMEAEIFRSISVYYLGSTREILSDL